MTDPSLIERLAVLPDLTDIPREELAWLVEHGEVHVYEDGERLLHGDDVTGVGLWVVISGRVSVRVDRDGVVREVREITPGRSTGMLPFSRMTKARGYLVADGACETLLIGPDHLREMVRECYDFTESCVHEMLERARVFKADDKHREKMAALGRLSAGLAHELNNPASAVVRAAQELDTAIGVLVAASRAIGEADLDEASRRALQALEERTPDAPLGSLSPVARADLEDGVMEWLEAHDIDPDLTYPLVERGHTLADLDVAASALGASDLALALRSVAAESAVRRLAAELSSAGTRVHSLVAAVKKHTHMDRAPAVEPIRLDVHLADAVALLGAKAELKGIALELAVEPDLPTVDGSVGDLNQVWMHLIDNAIDAGVESGRISITAAREADKVVVRVVDDGPGIPEEDHERVFEPFFTTKDVGQGRGLGLDIVRTVVRSHRGTVDLGSRPGRTELRVALPVTGSE